MSPNPGVVYGPFLHPCGRDDLRLLPYPAHPYREQTHEHDPWLMVYDGADARARRRARACEIVIKRKAGDGGAHIIALHYLYDWLSCPHQWSVCIVCKCCRCEICHRGFDFPHGVRRECRCHPGVWRVSTPDPYGNTDMMTTRDGVVLSIPPPRRTPSPSSGEEASDTGYDGGDGWAGSDDEYFDNSGPLPAGHHLVEWH